MIQIITISREFGSGGRSIGKMVAKKLGIPCYDKDKKRKLNYKYFTEQEWSKRQNYHLREREQSVLKTRHSFPLWNL